MIRVNSDGFDGFGTYVDLFWNFDNDKKLAFRIIFFVRLIDQPSRICHTLTGTHPQSHHEMLEEPRAHDVSGVFGQNPPLVFGLLVFAVQQGRQVHVYLWVERKRSRWSSLVTVAAETKEITVTQKHLQV